MSSPVSSPFASLWSRLDNLMLRDRQRLQRRLRGASKVNNPAAQQGVADEISQEIAAAEQRVA
ncbi:hypothetical protein, partial [Pantoea piersonii]